MKLRYPSVTDLQQTGFRPVVAGKQEPNGQPVVIRAGRHAQAREPEEVSEEDELGQVLVRGDVGSEGLVFVVNLFKYRSRRPGLGARLVRVRE